MTAAGDGRRAFGTLIRDLAEDTVALIRGETRLAKLELGRAASAIGRGTAFVALGTVFLLLGAVALLIGLILLAGDQWLPADRYWLAALIVLAVMGGAAALFVKRGLAQFSPTQIAPVDTAATLKENAVWVKRQLTSGGTSK
jgi:uncharacterized membrane protein YqjE